MTGPQCTPSTNTNSRRTFDKIKTLTTKYEAFALAAETRRNYNRGANAYVDFCLQLGLTDEQGSILAANENNLMYFAAHCAGFRGLAPGTIHNYLYGIRNWYIMRGLQDPLKHSNGQPLYRLSRVFRGIKKCHQLHAKKRLPITIQILRALVDMFSSGCFGLTEDCMMLAVVNLAFFGFLRCGEFTVLRSDQFDPSRNLLVKDVTFYPNHLQPTYMTVRLKYSKADPFGRGHIVTLYKTNTTTCPVKAMQQYLNSRRLSLDQPLFLTRGDLPLTRPYFLSLLRESLAKLGVSPLSYAGHSFRIGAATTAAASGLQDWLIRALGRWTSDCYKIYIRTPLPTLQTAAQSIATCQAFATVG